MQLIELSTKQLHSSANNPRIFAPDKDSSKELMASIKAIGMINPITVKKTSDGYEVIAGDRRYGAALSLGMETIPCNVIDADAEAIALAENVVRENMHPADEVRAFGQLVASGLTTKQIANKFGVKELLVKQRAALGNLCDEVLDLWRADKLDLDGAKLLTRVGRDRQLEIISDPGFNGTKWWISRSVVKNGMTDDDRLPAYVGIEYQAEGYPITKDLFSEDVIYHDVDKLCELAATKIMAEYGEREGLDVRVFLDQVEYPEGMARADEQDATVVCVGLDRSGEPFPLWFRPAEDAPLEENAPAPRPNRPAGEDPHISEALNGAYERIQRQAWVDHVLAGKADIEKLAWQIIESAIGDDIPLAFSEIRVRFGQNRIKYHPDNAVDKTIEHIICAYGVDPTAHDKAELGAFNVRDYWTPDEAFLKRLKGGDLHALISGLTQLDPLTTAITDIKRTEKEMSKGKWVEMAVQMFAHKFTESLDEGARVRIDSWLP